ncbi:MAG: hypothetical protein GJU76_05275 [Gallionella sp.]|jgi:hypothetical protein|nr:hypothetical protein [Gallionella sp.]
MTTIDPDEVRRQVYRNLSVEVPAAPEGAHAAAPKPPAFRPLFTPSQTAQFEKLSAAQMSADMQARGLFVGGGK